MQTAGQRVVGPNMHTAGQRVVRPNMHTAGQRVVGPNIHTGWQRVVGPNMHTAGQRVKGPTRRIWYGSTLCSAHVLCKTSSFINLHVFINGKEYLKPRGHKLKMELPLQLFCKLRKRFQSSLFS